LQQPNEIPQSQTLGFDIQPTSCHVVVGGTLGRRPPNLSIGHGTNLVTNPVAAGSSLYLTM